MRKQELLNGSLFMAARPWCVAVLCVGGLGHGLFLFSLVFFPSPGSV